MRRFLGYMGSSHSGLGLHRLSRVEMAVLGTDQPPTEQLKQHCIAHAFLFFADFGRVDSCCSWIAWGCKSMVALSTCGSWWEAGIALLGLKSFSLA